MTATRPIEEPLSAKEVGALLGVHRDTAKAIPREDLPYFRTQGGHRRYRREDVDAYIARRAKE